MVKRVFDICFCAAALAVLLPIFCIVAVAIKIASPGPVFYRGIRTGLRGKPFRIWKFRTMIVGAEAVGGGTTALDDPRVFSLGKVLRRYKIDELPQVFNVLSGEMSVVGPRPELPRYTERYSGEDAIILTVRPGITDLSSIEFSSLDEVVGSLDADRVFEEKVLSQKNYLRRLYVKQQSFFFDLKLIYLTVCRILQKIR